MTQGIAVQEREAPAVQEQEAPAAPECRHHWLIESPQGATSWGTCKICGAQREFINSAPDALWEGQSVPTSQSGPVVAYTTRDGLSGEDDEGF